MRLRIIGGTPPNHDTHLCDTCTHRDILRGTHMDEARCGARENGNLLIRGRIQTCTEYRPPFHVPGTRYKDAFTIVNLSHFGPVFFSPVEMLLYEDKGIVPDRYVREGEEGEEGEGPLRRRARMRFRRTRRNPGNPSSVQ